MKSSIAIILTLTTLFTHTTVKSQVGIIEQSMLLKTKKDVIAKHSNSDIYILQVDRHNKKDNFIVYTWHGLIGLGYYFTSDNICYEFEARTKGDKLDMTYANHNFKLVDNYWVDETKIYYLNDPKTLVSFYTRWDKVDKIINGENYVCLKATLYDTPNSTKMKAKIDTSSNDLKSLKKLRYQARHKQ